MSSEIRPYPVGLAETIVPEFFVGWPALFQTEDFVTRAVLLLFKSTFLPRRFPSGSRARKSHERFGS